MRTWANAGRLEVIPAIKCFVLVLPCTFNPTSAVGLSVVLTTHIIGAQMKQVRARSAPRMARRVEHIERIPVPMRRTVAIAVTRLVSTRPVRARKLNHRCVSQFELGQPDLISRQVAPGQKQQACKNCKLLLTRRALISLNLRRDARDLHTITNFKSRDHTCGSSVFRAAGCADLVVRKYATA